MKLFHPLDERSRNSRERTYRGYAATKPHAEREEHFADAAA
jgi:hypothetical protein